jgi:hypothetical protein
MEKPSMRIGSHDLEPGPMVALAFLVVVLIVVFFVWRSQKRLTEDGKSLAQAQGWTWYGAAPRELKDELAKLQNDSAVWKASRVMRAESSGNTVFLFYVQRQRSSQWSTDGVACLVPGEANPNAPVFTLERKSSGGVGTSVESLGWAYHGNPAGYFGKDETVALDAIELSPAFEGEAKRWTRPLGEAQLWSTIFVRGDVLLIVRRTNVHAMSNADWEGLFAMGDALGRARRTRE